MAEELLMVEARLKDFISGELKTISGNMKSFGKESEFSLGKMAGAMGIATSATQALSMVVGKAKQIYSESITEALEYYEVHARLTGVLISTGKNTEFATGELDAMNEVLAKLTLSQDDEIESAEAIALTFNSISKEDLPRLINAASGIAKLMGGDLTNATRMLGMAFDDPVAGTMRMRRAGVVFTGDQKEQIRTLVEEGRTLEAQARLLDLVEGKVGAINKAYRNSPIGVYTAATNELKEAEKELGKALLPIETFFIKMAATSLSNLTGTNKVSEAVTAKVQEYQAAQNSMTVNAKEMEGIYANLEKIAKKQNLWGLETPKPKPAPERTDAEIKENERREKEASETAQWLMDNEQKNALERQAFYRKQWDEKAAIDKAGGDAALAEQKRIADEQNAIMDDQFNRQIENFNKMKDLAQGIGVAIASGVGKGAEGLKESLKGILVTTLSFIEREILAAWAVTGIRSIFGDPTAFIQMVGVTAAFEVAKAGIQSFASGTFSARGGMAMVHQDELINLPSGSRVYTKEETREITNNNNTKPIIVVMSKGDDDIAGAIERATRDRSLNWNRILQGVI
jgi:hypothetical protein